MLKNIPAVRRLSVTLAAAGLAAAACVSPPRAVGPTTLSGPLPSAQEGSIATAGRAPGATDGPLRILEPRFTWTHASSTEATYEWTCAVENPADEGFRVTIVVRLLDESGRQLAAANQTLHAPGRATTPVRGDGLVEGDQMPEVASWRIEYWVETNPRDVTGEASAPLALSHQVDGIDIDPKVPR
jgi:hypothetical protein